MALARHPLEEYAGLCVIRHYIAVEQGIIGILRPQVRCQAPAMAAGAIVILYDRQDAFCKRDLVFRRRNTTPVVTIVVLYF